ncbi:MAG: restriction endonuclease subunit M, partial [Candidatus Nephrothrix sp. EaCA]
GFPEVFKRGGFDAVIGNPPWVDIKGHPPEQTKYFFKAYKTATNRINLYALFVEKALRLVNERGKFGFIIPNSLLYQSSYESLRKYLLDNWNIEKLVRLPDNVFRDVKAETLILTLGHESGNTQALIFGREETINAVTEELAQTSKRLAQEDFKTNEFCAFDIFSNTRQKNVIKKIERNTVELETICDFCLGLTPYDKHRGHTKSQIKNRVFHSATKKNNTFKKLLEGSDIERYHVKWGGNEYISYGKWLGAPRELKFFKSPRILVRQIISGMPRQIYAAYTEEELYNTQSAFNIISKSNSNYDLKFLLALINSSVLNFYHSDKYLDKSKNLFQKILIQNCKKLPIKAIDFKNENITYNEIIKQVNLLLKLNEEIKAEKLQTKVEQIKQRIEYGEDKINRLVYELYGLSKSDIKIIEQQ